MSPYRSLNHTTEEIDIACRLWGAEGVRRVFGGATPREIVQARHAHDAARRAGPPKTPVQQARAGLLWGALGVLAFSFTFVAIRAADRGFGGWTVGIGRGAIAAPLVALIVLARREAPPARRHWPRLLLVAVGVVLGFPIASALALQRLPAAHGAVLAGIIPVATAAWVRLLSDERPSARFWLFAAGGVVAVLLLALALNGGALQPADGLLLAGVLLCGLGYAAGGQVAREIGGPSVICWAVIAAAPLTVPLFGLTAVRHGLQGGASAWVGFGYVCGVSTVLGFFAWYRGLALGGVARVAQLQLVQPVLTVLWAAALLGETITPLTAGAAALLVAGAALAVRAPVLQVGVAAFRSPRPARTAAEPLQRPVP